MISCLSSSMSLDRLLCINIEEKTESPSQSLLPVNNTGAELWGFFSFGFFSSVSPLFCMNALGISYLSAQALSVAI